MFRKFAPGVALPICLSFSYRLKLVVASLKGF